MVDWSTKNKLTINKNKTQGIIFYRSNRIANKRHPTYTRNHKGSRGQVAWCHSLFELIIFNSGIINSKHCLTQLLSDLNEEDRYTLRHKNKYDTPDKKMKNFQILPFLEVAVINKIKYGVLTLYFRLIFDLYMPLSLVVLLNYWTGMASTLFNQTATKTHAVVNEIQLNSYVSVFVVHIRMQHICKCMHMYLHLCCFFYFYLYICYAMLC